MKSIDGFNDYYVTLCGRVISKKYHKQCNPNSKLKQLKPWFNKGYEYITLVVDNVKHKRKVHRLIAQAFINNNQNKPYINHKNGNKSDNRVSNLE